jgi:hypothetical protein
VLVSFPLASDRPQPPWFFEAYLPVAVISSANRAHGIFWRISAVRLPTRSCYVLMCTGGYVSLVQAPLSFMLHRCGMLSEVDCFGKCEAPY